ncbi:MAG: GrpB family protein, partial [Verrucomicrobiota bacterium]
MSEENQAPIHLEDYNPEWPSLFIKEKNLLEGLIGNYLKGSIEHIGSTSVVGLAAKPVI